MEKVEKVKLLYEEATGSFEESYKRIEELLQTYPDLKPKNFDIKYHSQDKYINYKSEKETKFDYYTFGISYVFKTVTKGKSRERNAITEFHKNHPTLNDTGFFCRVVREE